MTQSEKEALGIFGLLGMAGYAFYKLSGKAFVRENPIDIDQDELKTVIFIEEDEEEAIEDEFYYLVVEEDEDQYLVVLPDKFDRWKANYGTRDEWYYAEWFPKDEMKEIEV